jgi:hypothetical protein
VSGKIKDRAQTIVAGASLGAIGLLLLLFAIGSRDETKEEPDPTGGAPKGETYGGVYRPACGEPSAYENPAYKTGGQCPTPARWERRQ